MKYIKRTLRVSLPTIRKALESKESFEALAFCVMAKLNITSSTLNNVTCRSLKETTHLGTKKLNQILSYCEEHGMIKRDGNKIVFKPLSRDGVLSYEFHNRYASRRKKKGEKAPLVFNLRLYEVKDMLRRAVLAHHFKRLESIRQTIMLTINPSCVNDYRRGRGLRRRLAVWGDDFYISNKRMAKVARCCVSKARAIKRGMVAHGEITKDFCKTVLCDDADLFNIDLFYERFGKDNFIFRGVNDNKVYLQHPNIYCYKGKNIVFSKITTN